MRFFSLLHIEPGVTAVIGSGGKTTLLRTLAQALPGTVALCTTTHIRPFADVPLLTGADAERLSALLQRVRVVCVGTPCGDGKLTAPALPLAELAALADYVLVEADGSRGLPLKAHASHEPVLPQERRQTVCVVGASGFGRSVAAAVHRPERFCALTGAELQTPVTPELAARAIAAEGLADCVLLNQIDEEAMLPLGRRFAAAVGVPVVAGSLRRDVWTVFGERS